MQHYICTGGCGGESATGGVCQMEGCAKEGQPLISCDCTDSVHAAAKEKKSDDADSDSQ